MTIATSSGPSGEISQNPNQNGLNEISILIGTVPTGGGSKFWQEEKVQVIAIPIAKNNGFIMFEKEQLTRHKA